MTLLDILAVVLPIASAFAYDSFTKLQRTREQEKHAAERVRDTMRRERERDLDEEMKQALRNALLEIDAQAKQIKALEDVIREHATTLNKLAEREF